MRPPQDLLELPQGVHPEPSADHRGSAVQLQVEAGDDAEEPRAGAPGCPVDVGVLVWARVPQLAVTVHVVDRQHALAGEPQRARVPTEAALQQEAAKTDALAVAHGEEELPLCEHRVEVVAPPTGSGRGDHRVLVDRHVVQAREVEEHPALAYVVAGPAVPPGPDADLPSVLRGHADRGDDVRLVARLHDHVREEVGQVLVAARRAPRLRISRGPTFDDLAGGRRR